MNRCALPRTVVVILCTLAIVLSLTTFANAQRTDPASLEKPTLIADKISYMPGETIVFSGGSWKPGEGGTIVVLSSVAAERPRRANVVYGASKAGLDSLAQGLGDALYEHDVHVLVVRPGFVETKMTRGLAAAPLATTTRAVAIAVADGLERGANTVWVPRTLRWLMLMMRLLPRSIFRRIRQ